MPGLQLPWNEELETLLCYCVLAKGAHISSTASNWNAVNNMFFSQPQLADKKAVHFTEGEAGCRKLKDRLKKIIAAVTTNIETGNQSGKEGDLSDLFKHVKQIEDEREEKKAAAKNKREFQDTLNQTQLEVLAKASGTKIKHLNGKLTDSTKKNSKATESFESVILGMLKEDPNEKKVKRNSEDDFEVLFLQWLHDNDKDIFDLLEVSELNIAANKDVVSEIGMQTLVNLHCTRESECPAAAFKNELKEFGLQPLVCSKLYVGLQKWRREVEKVEMSSMTQETSSSSSQFSLETPGSVPRYVGNDIMLASSECSSSVVEEDE